MNLIKTIQNKIIQLPDKTLFENEWNKSNQLNLKGSMTTEGEQILP